MPSTRQEMTDQLSWKVLWNHVLLYMKQYRALQTGNVIYKALLTIANMYSYQQMGLEILFYFLLKNLTEQTSTEMSVLPYLGLRFLSLQQNSNLLNCIAFMTTHHTTVLCFGRAVLTIQLRTAG